MIKKSKTGWKRLAEMKDEDIDTSDIPELGEESFRNAKRLVVTPKGLQKAKPSPNTAIPPGTFDSSAQRSLD
jgi:hypothetical protein